MQIYPYMDDHDICDDDGIDHQNHDDADHHNDDDGGDLSIINHQ